MDKLTERINYFSWKLKCQRFIAWKQLNKVKLIEEKVTTIKLNKQIKIINRWLKTGGNK